MVSQSEIERAYREGWDVMELYQKRLLVLQVILAIGLTIGAVLAFWAAYEIKSALGINLFEWHLGDLL